MWLWLSLTALLCWSGSDLFSKIGCRDGSDRYSHLKMVIAVGVVMGLHAAFEIFVGGTAISWSVIWTYLPVSLLYISSMALGYLGLRYIELSVSSPICNSSGALVAVLTLLFVGGEDYSPLALLAIALVCTGAIGLGVWMPRRTQSFVWSGRRPATISTPRAFSPSPSPRPTACWTPPAPLPTTGCWRF